jgi:hypothetical protein
MFIMPIPHTITLDESPRIDGLHFAASTDSHPSDVNRWYQVFVAKYDEGPSTHSTPGPPKHDTTSSSFGPKTFPLIPLAPIIPPPVPVSTPMDELEDFPFESTQQDDAPSPAPLPRTEP